MSFPKYVTRYPQVMSATPRVKSIIDLFPKEKISRGTQQQGLYELEARFGTLERDPTTHKEFFKAGVSQEFMRKSLHRLQQFGEWCEVTPWVETTDYYYALPPGPDDLNDKGLLVRTTTEYNKDAALWKPTHICKTLRDKQDFRYIASLPSMVETAPSPNSAKYDLRVSLNFEERVPDELIPQAVPDLRYVRIKSRKSFRCASKDTKVPVWSFDFTQSWAGATFEEAEQKQKRSDTCFEIELECLDPFAYLHTAKNDPYMLAMSMLLKMRDFIGPAVPFHWEPVRPHTFFSA